MKSNINKSTFPDFNQILHYTHKIKAIFTSVPFFLNNLFRFKSTEQNYKYLCNSRLVFNNTSDGILLTDNHHKIIDVNNAFTAITGYSKQESLGQSPSFLQSGRHNKHFYQHLWHCLKKTGQWQGEIWNRRKNGEIYPELLTINIIRDDNGDIAYHMGVFSDISHVDIKDLELDHLAFHDHLTGLPNRLMLQKRLKQAMICANNSQLSFALFFIDFDGFKSVNDTYGHDFGDSILNMAANRLNNAKRRSDFLARVGGDEFIMIITSLSDEAIIPKIAQNIIDSMKLPFHLDSHSIIIGASIGISLYPAYATDSLELIKQADSAMYHAKTHGRNNFSFFQHHFH